MRGSVLNRKWKVGAKHALYRKSGDWYHQLINFPGALFDENGYVVFETEDEYRNCSFLQIKQDVHVPKGISSIPSYVQIVIDGKELIPDKIAVKEPDVHYEGTVRDVHLTSYERDPVARAKCISYHGLNCKICGINFGKIYGEVGAGFIHIHHLIPLSQIGKQYKVDPKQDLLPVCPNCHAIIHRRTPPYSIKEVINMINHKARRT